MPDQVGTIDNTFDLQSKEASVPALDAAYNISGGMLTRGIVCNGYLYICVYHDASESATKVLNNIYKLNLSNPFDGWQTVLSGYWQVNSTVNMRHSQIAVDGTRFYYLGSRYGEITNGSISTTAYFDCADEASGWRDGQIANTCTDTYAQTFWSTAFADDNYIYIWPVNRSNNRDQWFWKTPLTLPKSNLITGTWTIRTSQAPNGIGDFSCIFYGGKLYFFGGYVASGTPSSGALCGGTYTSQSTASSQKSAVWSYDSATETWDESALPAIPAWGLQDSFAVLAYDVVYLFQPTYDLYHFYDMKNGKEGTWVSMGRPWWGATGNYPNSLSYDNVLNRLIYIDSDGKTFFHRLDSNHYPVGSWSGTVYGMVGPAQSGSTDITVEITSTVYDVFSSSTTDTTFTIASAGQKISSHTQVSINPQTFTITTSIAAALGAIQIDNIDCDFVFTTSALDVLPTTDVAFTFVANGTATIVNNVQSLGSEIDFVIVQDASGALGVIAHANSVITVDSQSTGFVGIVETRQVNQNIRITIDAFGYENIIGQSALRFIVGSSSYATNGYNGVGSASFAIESEASTLLNCVQHGSSNATFAINTTIEANYQTIGAGRAGFVINSLSTGFAGISGEAESVFEFLSLSGGTQGIIGYSNVGTFLINQYFAIGVVKENNEIVNSSNEVNAWAVNGQTGGHAALINYNFNGFFTLNGKLYGTNAQGIFDLTGATDNGETIEWYVASPVSDFGERRLKSASDIYINVRADGDIVFRVVSDEQKDRQGYMLASHDRNGLHRRRRKLHKGIRATNWQFEARNSGEVHAEIADVDLTPVILKRSI